jgi:hypothetical protein
MSSSTRFPFLRWMVTTLTGRWARRIYIAIVLFVLLLTTAVRLREYFIARKIQAVLRGLAEIRIDQTTEEELKKIVPYLTEKDWRAGDTVRRGFYATISNETDPRVFGLAPYGLGSSGLLVDWLGYRYISFDAGVFVEDGKVTHVHYGLANEWVRPQYAGYTGYKVSARSVHGFWLPRQRGFEVSSVDDDSPQYRPRGDNKWLSVIYTNDAPPELTQRSFQLDLSCFWALRGCDDARDIAPALWQDVQAIKAATHQQLISGKCPESIIEGRMRYLPDITVLLLEVTGSRRVEVNEEGAKTEDWFTDYKLKEVIRGQDFESSWKNVRTRPMIPSPADPAIWMANQISPPTQIGSQALFFGGLGFDSCRIIPATPSALEIVRKTPVPPKRPEDQIPSGLQ